jgi:tetratricopeptide (TPR) repeat protein
LVHPEPAEAELVQEQASHAQSNELTALVADLEASLGDSFPAAPPVVAQSPAGSEPSGELSEDNSAPAQSPDVQPSPQNMPGWPVAAGGSAAAAAPAMSYCPAPLRPLGPDAQAPSSGVDLSEMFSELKHELEEGIPAAADDDPETHYSLAAAFREMGLLDEAIAELQQVCAAIDRGHPFTQTIQTYTWLGQCLIDKGVPEAAIPWYEKALNIPGLDSETRVAINYELGAACEKAHDRPAALRHFTSVYGANIDYRDVAERIHALKS